MIRWGVYLHTLGGKFYWSLNVDHWKVKEYCRLGTAVLPRLYFEVITQVIVTLRKHLFPVHIHTVRQILQECKTYFSVNTHWCTFDQIYSQQFHPPDLLISS